MHKKSQKMYLQAAPTTWTSITVVSEFPRTTWRAVHSQTVHTRTQFYTYQNIITQHSITHCCCTCTSSSQLAPVLQVQDYGLLIQPLYCGIFRVHCEPSFVSLECVLLVSRSTRFLLPVSLLSEYMYVPQYQCPPYQWPSCPVSSVPVSSVPKCHQYLSVSSVSSTSVLSTEVSSVP